MESRGLFAGLRESEFQIRPCRQRKEMQLFGLLFTLGWLIQFTRDDQICAPLSRKNREREKKEQRMEVWTQHANAEAVCIRPPAYSYFYFIASVLQCQKLAQHRIFVRRRLSQLACCWLFLFYLFAHKINSNFSQNFYSYLLAQNYQQKQDLNSPINIFKQYYQSINELTLCEIILGFSFIYF